MAQRMLNLTQEKLPSLCDQLGSSALAHRHTVRIKHSKFLGDGRSNRSNRTVSNTYIPPADVYLDQQSDLVRDLVSAALYAFDPNAHSHLLIVRVASQRFVKCHGYPLTDIGLSSETLVSPAQSKCVKDNSNTLQ